MIDKTKTKTIVDIPKGWFVYYVDLECAEPYAVVCPKENSGEYPIGYEEMVSIPKPLAYFLVTHWAGTDALKKMHRRELANEIKRCLEIPWGGQAPMSEFKRIESNPYAKVAKNQYGGAVCSAFYEGAEAQLTQCKADQKEERRALGELLEKDMMRYRFVEGYSALRKLDEHIEALKQGTLPEGIKEVKWWLEYVMFAGEFISMMRLSV
jgi:hypothetical protein